MILPEPKHTVLVDEQRFVRFEIDGVARVIEVDSVLAISQTGSDVDVSIVQVLVCEAGPCSQQITAIVNGSNINLDGNDVFRSFSIPASSLMDTTTALNIVVAASATDRDGQTAQSSENVFVRASVRRVTDSVITLTGAIDEVTQPSDLIVLGYFGFDGDTFTSTSDDGVRQVREAIGAGRSVTLIPQTDDLGTAEHNSLLRRKRGQAAVALLGARSASSVKVDTRSTSAEVGDSPMRRMARRSVLARIQ